jgi:hypothetical protein
VKTLKDVKARKRELLAACAALNGKDFAARMSRGMVQQALLPVRRREIGARIQRARRPVAILESVAYDMATHAAGLRDWKRVDRLAFHYGAEMLDGYLMAMKESKAC